MKFAYSNWYCEGCSYSFNGQDLGIWLDKELRNLLKPSEYFTKKYGRDWTVGFALSAKRGRKNPQIIWGPEVNRRLKSVEWGISVAYVGNKSLDPKSYALPIRQFLQGIIVILQSLEIDASMLIKHLPLLVKDFTSNPDVIIELVQDPGGLELDSNTAVRRKRLPKWKIPKNIERLVEENGGTWESERFDPLRLLVLSGVRDDREVLRWQIELDIDLHDKQYADAGEKIKDLGRKPDGDGWTELIEKEFTKRYPKYASGLDSDSETSTCVVSVASEEACQKLIELVWSLIYAE